MCEIKLVPSCGEVWIDIVTSLWDETVEEIEITNNYPECVRELRVNGKLRMVCVINAHGCEYYETEL